VRCPGTIAAAPRLPAINGRSDMIRWAVIFLVLGLVMAVLGFGGIGGAFIDIAKILFFVAIAVFVVLLILGIVAGKKIAGG
jgi:uncharacterized membrane protein YtjA (UPF0391 family)